MSAAVNETNGVAILSRVIRADDSELSADGARSLLALKFPVADERRMNRLAAKARKGTLSSNERSEADQYNLVSHLLALLQARARNSLSKSSDAKSSA